MVTPVTDTGEAVGLILTGSGAVKAATISIDELRLTPRRLDALDRKLPNARSVAVAAFPYFAGFREPPVSLYAHGADYVPVLRTRMENAARLLRGRWPQNDFTVLADGSPLPIVEAAHAAGLTLRGKNGLALLPPYGSFLFLSAIVTDRDWAALLPPNQTCSDSCTRCLDSCPTGALRDDGLDRDICLSSLSQRRELTEEQHALLRKTPTLWGCDLCQLCCPYNEAPQLSPYPEFTENLLPERFAADDLEGRACNRYGFAHLERNADIGGLHL